MASDADAAVRARLGDEIRGCVEAVIALAADVRAALAQARTSVDALSATPTRVLGRSLFDDLG